MGKKMTKMGKTVPKKWTKYWQNKWQKLCGQSYDEIKNEIVEK